MPTPQPSSEFLLAQLKEKVAHNFDQPVITKADCNKLSELIKIRTIIN